MNDIPLHYGSKAPDQTLVGIVEWAGSMVTAMGGLTLTVPVTAIESLGHFETG